MIEDFLIKAVEKTDGWVLVVLFAMYVCFRIYKKFMDSQALSKTLGIVDTTIKSLLKNVTESIDRLTSRIIDSLESKR